MGTEQDLSGWTPDLSVGNSLLDQQHKHLVALFHKAVKIFDESQRWNESCSEVLNDIAECAMAHFVEEERLLTKNGYPQLEAHRDEHCEYLDSINDAILQAMRGLLDRDHLLARLSEWVGHHLAETDQSAKSYFK